MDTTQPANDNYHRALVGDGSDLPSPIRYLPHERDGIRMQKKRLAKLEAKRPDWISPPVNDNQAWPLAQQLRKEGNDVLLRVAERYRAIYDAATADTQLVGTSLAGDDIYNLDRDARVKDDGTIEFKGARRLRRGEDRVSGPDEGKKPITFKPKSPSRVTKAWNGDAMLIAAIDCRALLWKLQSALGPLVDVFEEAVLHGETLSAIGERHGVTPQKSGAAGKAMVMIGLQTVREKLNEYDRDLAS